jgi:hypothetical protein
MLARGYRQSTRGPDERARCAIRPGRSVSPRLITRCTDRREGNG